MPKTITHTRVTKQLSHTNIVAENIRRCRVFWGIKQTVFAKELKVSRRTLSSYENGHTPIPVDLLKRLSSKLGLADNAEIFFNPDFVPPKPLFKYNC